MHYVNGTWEQSKNSQKSHLETFQIADRVVGWLLRISSRCVGEFARQMGWVRGEEGGVWGRTTFFFSVSICFTPSSLWCQVEILKSLLAVYLTVSYHYEADFSELLWRAVRRDIRVWLLTGTWQWSYTFNHTCVYVCVHIYIYTLRSIVSLNASGCIYIYIHTLIYMCVYIYRATWLVSSSGPNNIVNATSYIYIYTHTLICMCVRIYRAISFVSSSGPTNIVNANFYMNIYINT